VYWKYINRAERQARSGSNVMKGRSAAAVDSPAIEDRDGVAGFGRQPATGSSRFDRLSRRRVANPLDTSTNI
jgi:hypothetical protein